MPLASKHRDKSSKFVVFTPISVGRLSSGWEAELEELLSEFDGDFD
jgi:hypothetical protein